ncbi:signal peptidase II [Lactobacillus xylocopicola]|uniref:Lipoprotein signal peptidase n=1 Tax=Lactobacillus xylocopicola TaxID=2976676 RepID=A0ABM8BGU2_9LACO|nr:signal peptidase II [Lactobacillus xylocopicola]BDR60497.1 lipoprotein signal peptidase [Lactobacillus xylocopicola]
MQFLYLLITLLVVGADQGLKNYIAQNYQLGEVHSVIPNLLSFTYVQNDGAAWNILTGQMWLFYIISAVAIIICLYYLFKVKKQRKLFNYGVALVLGGIIGNLLDRIHLKYVIDMIQVDFVRFNIFNIADSAITVGIILVFIYLLFFDESDPSHA